MNNDLLVERKKWFRFFPEGSIEFLLVTRVLALLMLAAFIIVNPSQRPAVLTALAFLVWVDYLLMLWWAVQLTTDLDDLFQDPMPTQAVSHRRRVHTALLVALPSLAAFLALAPWPALLNNYIPRELFRTTLPRVLLPVLLVLFVVFAFMAQRALQRIRLGPPFWTLLFLIPLLHFFAMHRLLAVLHGRLQHRCQEHDKPVDEEPGPGIALIFADVTWVLSILPWGIVLVLAMGEDGSWPTAAPLCGTGLAAVFTIADLAAMEALQRQFVALIRKR